MTTSEETFRLSTLSLSAVVRRTAERVPIGSMWRYADTTGPVYVAVGYIAGGLGEVHVQLQAAGGPTTDQGVRFITEEMIPMYRDHHAPFPDAGEVVDAEIVEEPGVWVYAYADHSGCTVFAKEIHALRHAASFSNDVRFVPFGHDVFTGKPG